MAEMKDRNTEEKAQNLKRADSQKTIKDTAQGSGLRAELFGGKRITERTPITNIKIKKKLPVAVDIIAGILMLVLVCAVIVGSYVLFRYYSNDYDGVDVEYTVTFSVDSELNTYNALKNGELFMDVTGNSVYFGKIVGVETVANEENESVGGVILTVKANVKYRQGEGYSIGDSRLAVGSRLNLRCAEKSLSVLVTALDVEE